MTIPKPEKNSGHVWVKARPKPAQLTVIKPPPAHNNAASPF